MHPNITKGRMINSLKQRFIENGLTIINEFEARLNNI
jgi:hypothetical protein